MRSLVLVDETMNQTTLTLWGPKATEFDCEIGAVISVRRAKVSRYQGPSCYASFHSDSDNVG